MAFDDRQGLLTNLASMRFLYKDLNLRSLMLTSFNQFLEFWECSALYRCFNFKVTFLDIYDNKIVRALFFCNFRLSIFNSIFTFSILYKGCFLKLYQFNFNDGMVNIEFGFYFARNFN